MLHWFLYDNGHRHERVKLIALSREFHTSCSWELLHADDLALIAETLDLLMEKLKLWKDTMENKGLRVNMGILHF